MDRVRSLSRSLRLMKCNANAASFPIVAGFPQQFAPQYGQVPQNFAPNQYMMGNMQGFQMNQPGMTPQQAQQLLQQRIQAQQQHLQQQQQQQQQHQHQQQQQHPQLQQHPNQQAQQHPQHQQMQQHPGQQVQQQHPQQGNMGQVGTPQRPPSAAQNSPAGQMPGQPQFSPHQMPQGTPQQGGQMQQHPQQHPQQQPQQPGAIATPQTPTFPGNQGPNVGAGAAGPPLSPASESREKERFALLLDINHELLYESILLQNTQAELKREAAAANGNAGERKPTEEESLFQQDYVQ